ncbi:MAG: flippase-like domain-containing protein [Clostridia bacterium]|nr:flippase-like domain-containing protein [Clostridia bacterium]
MKKLKPQDPIIQKIEFDSKTKEPITIQIRGEDLPETIVPEPEVKEEHDFKNADHKQLVMKGVFGFEPNNSAIDKRQRFIKNLFSIIFVVVVVGVLVWTAINDFASGEPLPSWSEVWQTLSKNWYFLLLALLMLGGFYGFKALKLSAMCKSMTGKFHLKTCLETAVVGIYYNNVTPFAIGGQPFEIYHLSKHGVHGGVASSLPIATYFLNQIAFVIMGFAFVFMYTSNTLDIPSEMIGVMPTILNIVAIVGLSFSLIMPVIIILFSLLPRFTSKLVAGVLHIGNKLHIIKNPKATAMKTYKTVIHNSRCIKKIASRPVVFISTFLMSFLEHICGTSIAYFVLCFFGFNWGGGMVEWLQVVQLCFLINVAISIIPTPGNAGAADLSFYLLFKTGLGLSAGLQVSGYAFPAMITWRILSFYSTIIIGFAFTNLKKRSDRRKKLKNVN